MEHRAQTMLYTLLAAERYGVEVPSGLLYYTQSEEVTRVPASRNEIRGLIIARNEMASYMMRRNLSTGEEAPSMSESFLPPTIDDERVCRGKCRRRFLSHRRYLRPQTSPLTPPRAEFFQRWEGLISLEEQDLVRFKKELWTMGAAERELKG
ncbi:hypothetical protein H0H87_001139, partial [Tephrocybe sp. NHM501043]